MELLDILMKMKGGTNMLHDEIPQLQSEINKMNQEDRIVEIKAKSYIDNFINDIKKMDKSQLFEVSKPQKVKIPFKVKLQRFFNKLNNTLG